MTLYCTIISLKQESQNTNVVAQVVCRRNVQRSQTYKQKSTASAGFDRGLWIIHSRNQRPNNQVALADRHYSHQNKRLAFSLLWYRSDVSVMLKQWWVCSLMSVMVLERKRSNSCGTSPGLDLHHNKPRSLSARSQVGFPPASREELSSDPHQTAFSSSGLAVCDWSATERPERWTSKDCVQMLSTAALSSGHTSLSNISIKI